MKHKRALSLFLSIITMMIITLESSAYLSAKAAPVFLADIPEGRIFAEECDSIETWYSHTHSNHTKHVSAKVYSNNLNALNNKIGVSANADCISRIKDYWAAVDSNEWTDWITTFAPSARFDAEDLILRDENHRSNIGILTVISAQILSIKASDPSSVVRDAYPSLAKFFKSDYSNASYDISVNLQVKEENGYFKNGFNCFTMTLIKENGLWGVAAMCDSQVSEACCDKHNGISHDNRDTPAPGSLVGFATLPSCRAVPSTVNVKDQYSAIHKNVPFDTYMANVIFNEIRHNSPVQAEYAHILVVKTLTWCYCVKKPYAAYGYDIHFGMVSYTPTLPDEATPQAMNQIKQYINAMKPYCMVTSNSTGGKLFFSDFSGYKPPSNGGISSGVFYQTQAIKLAKGEIGGKEYNWQEILHYFYDNSSNDANNQYNVGTIRFISPGSHTYKGYSTSLHYHWYACTKCSNIKASSYQAHNWILSGGQQICKVCKVLRIHYERNMIASNYLY